MGTEPAPVTLAQVVQRAVQVCDPDGDEGLADLLARFEDDDEPLSSTSAQIAEQRIAEEIGALDPQDEDPAVTMAGAVATYLAYRRDELGDDPADILVLAARAEFEGKPPANVTAWLADRAIAL
jgi:hypothetical protein